MRVAAAGATLALGAIGLVGCSSSGGGSGGGGGGSSSSGGTGPITYVQGKDTSGVVNKLAAIWNKAHPKEKVTVKQQSDQADQQHDDLAQHLQQKLSDYDVFSIDVVWSAEFAAKGWLQPLTGAYKLDTSPFLPSVVKTGQYHGVQYAAPSTTDSQILYYRKDLLGSTPPPTTWDEMMKDCSIAKKANIPCYAGQFAKYEGLTVNFNEAVTSAGGTVVDAKGNPTLDTPEAKAGLTRLTTAFANGNIPKAALTYQEAQGLSAFETGKLLFLTNWPYAVSAIKTDGTSVVKTKFGISGYPGKSAVGGHNLAISAYSNHKATALAFVKFMESEQAQTMNIQVATLAPVRTSSYTDTSLTKQFPYLTTLKASLDNAVARPISPYYPAITTAIENDTYKALTAAANGQNPDVSGTLSSISAAIKAAGTTG
jgi:multiple sugar transport system substrate-binding protein